MIPDGAAPSLTISGVPGTIARGASFVATFTFTGSVVGFEATDISLSNATQGALTRSGAVYSANITPDNRGDVTVSVTDRAARDLTGEPSVAASASVQLVHIGGTERWDCAFPASASAQADPEPAGRVRFISGQSAGQCHRLRVAQQR